ncbi:MAG TPA: STAS domain-containing protein [bacterium]|nr:STAS domain-containing protein [bacterium]
MGAWSLSRRTEPAIRSDIITLRGDIDLSNVHQLQGRLSELETNGRHLVLDLSGLTFFDLRGVRLLESVSEICRTQGVQFLLISPSMLVRRVLDTAGSRRSIPVLENLDAAARHLRDQASGTP